MPNTSGPSHHQLLVQSGQTASDKPIVFFVDESADHRQQVAHIFNESLSGYDLRLFTDITSVLNAHVPDEQMGLLLIIGYLQGVDGLNLINRLKQQSRWKYVPIVVMSSEASADQVSACYEAGANSFVVTPIGSMLTQQVLQRLCSYWFVIHQYAVAYV